MKWKKPFLIGLFVLIIVCLSASLPRWAPGGFGFNDAPVTVTKIAQNLPGNVVKETTVTVDGGKTLWDWLNLLGAPLSLALLGYWFQTYQRQQAEKVAEEQRYFAAEASREEVLQDYFDRISSLLVEQKVLSLANRKENHPEKITAEERELLDTVSDIIQARTLSVLRRFGDDGQRKEGVIRFLIETEIIRKLNLNLSRANLRCTDLRGADFCGANLTSADFTKSDCAFAFFTSAILSQADFSEAKLNGANLERANLYGAHLNGSDLSKANLTDAKLHFADLRDAILSTAIMGGIEFNAKTLGLPASKIQ